MISNLWNTGYRFQSKIESTYYAWQLSGYSREFDPAPVLVFSCSEPRTRMHTYNL